jgi:anti-sigma regulatory factor (Ser/Thr protein kinase)
MPKSESLGDADVAQWPDPLRIRTAAHGSQVRVVRRRLSRWLHGDHLDTDLVDDLVLAASEALENCCDHAYTGASAGGTMTLTAQASDATLTITVTDDGCWQEAPAEPGVRGRGLAMMRELVDDVAVESGPQGTQLALTHHL